MARPCRSHFRARRKGKTLGPWSASAPTRGEAIRAVAKQYAIQCAHARATIELAQPPRILRGGREARRERWKGRADARAGGTGALTRARPDEPARAAEARRRAAAARRQRGVGRPARPAARRRASHKDELPTLARALVDAATPSSSTSRVTSATSRWPRSRIASGKRGPARDSW